MRKFRLEIILLILAILSVAASAQQAVESIVVNKSLTIPRVAKAPAIEDFLSMKPSAAFANGEMAKVTQYVQRDPHDGAPASQRTETYLGYDSKSLYVVFVCFDAEPQKIRASMGRREGGMGDENAEIMLDTFSDQRRAYGFMSNPLGVQTDGIWTEGSGWDMSFDALWYSKGKLTPEGYVVWMAIPFKSLRFPATGKQSWGILLNRDIPRNNESSFWPAYSAKIEGRMNQEGRLEGLENISPGRNMQFIPYMSAKAYREPDFRDTSGPTGRFDTKSFKGDMGLDSKFVIKDSFVLDTTINPDFGQVESDEPQITANRRFETFYPERRPFFIENASYFETPINLVFTRRVMDPDYGVRLTGKRGPYSVGVLFADDRSPGRQLVDSDPLATSQAYFGVIRLQRDILNQSTLGMIYTERDYQGDFNRVGGIDGRIKLNSNWVTKFQAVTSSTEYMDGETKVTQGGPAFTWNLSRSGRKFNYNATYNDTSAGFLTKTGFFRRPDLRSFNQNINYRFRPEGKHLIAHGPYFGFNKTYDHQGFLLNDWSMASYNFNFAGQTYFEVGYGFGGEGLRPSDYDSVTQNVHYSTSDKYIYFESNYFKKVGFWLNIDDARGPSYIGKGLYDLPVDGGQRPRNVRDRSAAMGMTLRPLNALKIENKYTWEQWHDPLEGQSQYNMHVVRSKWNYQFTKELSLRFIATYQGGLANERLSYLNTTKQFNTDFLITYLLHPGTAIYVGYNSNLANFDPALRYDENSEPIRPRNHLINDSRQFFVKVSYLFRF